MVLFATPSAATLTTSPASIITPAPHFHHDVLKRRSNATPDTCGWVSGNSEYPLTCPAGYGCSATAYYGAGFTAWGCCNAVQCNGLYQYCQNAGQVGLCANLDSSACSAIYGAILTCSSEAPLCFAYAVSLSVGASDTLFSLGCGTATNTILALATITGTGGDSGSGSTAGGGAFSNNDGLPSYTYTLPTSGATGVASGDGGSTTTSGSSSNSGLSTAIIAVIAVLGALGLIACGLFVWWIRRCIRPRIDDIREQQRPSGPPTVPSEPSASVHGSEDPRLRAAAAAAYSWNDGISAPPMSQYSGTTYAGR